MSEMRRAAQALQERRVERFESIHSAAESRSRLTAALERSRIGDTKHFVPHWKEENGRVVLEAEFLPPGGTRGLVHAISIALFVLICASIYVATTLHEGTIGVLLPLCTLLSILGFPLLILGLSSQREAVESRIRRAI